MRRYFFRLALLSTASAAFASQAQMTVNLDLVEAAGITRSIGTVTLADSQFGVVLTPALRDLPPGVLSP